MLWPLSWADVNCRSMFHTLEINNHALTVVMRRWQLTGHVSYLRNENPCSDLCHVTMTNAGASFIPSGWITMLWPLSWDDYNCRSMFHTLETNSHALTVVMRRWQLTEHVSYLRNENPCSVRCHVTMTTVSMFHIYEMNNHALTVVIRRWQLTEHGSYLSDISMLWPLSLDDNNWRSMVHTLGIYNHALTVVTRWWQLTEHGSHLRDKLPCSDRCH